MRVLLDTNIWRYLVDAQAIPLLRRSNHEVLVAPAVVYEAFRTHDVELRTRLVDALTLPHWRRLMPEAYSESMEVIAEIRRVRPDWMRDKPDKTLFNRLRYDWRASKGGFWYRARHETERERALVANPSLLTQAQAQARAAREEAKSFPRELERASFRTLRGAFGEDSGESGRLEFEPWRYTSMVAWMQGMHFPGHPYQDWLNPFVITAFLAYSSPSLEMFWLRDVGTSAMPRNWLRFVFEYQQRFHRVTAGTPGDAQLGTYLVDADVMFSADKNFVRFAERASAEAPFAVARSVLVPAGAAAVEAVLAALVT